MSFREGQFREDGAAAVDWVASYLERLRDFPVLAQVEPGELRSRLPAAAPETGEPFAAILRDLDDVLLPAVTHWQSPRFFAYFVGTASEPGILAELLMAGLNQVGILWRTSPALQELEEVTLAWLAQLLGLPPGLARPPRGRRLDRDDGGARRRARGEARGACRRLLRARALVGREGVQAPRPRGRGRRPSTRRFACGRTRSTSRARAPSSRRSGRPRRARSTPFGRIADACEREGVWLHVDAAYAGSAAVCPELRDAFAGWERADSVVVNPHKWLFTPMGCSALWTRRPDDLRAAFSLVPEYLRVSEEVASLSEYSPALGRQFRALKLWAVLRCYGREGLQRRIREAIALAALFEGWVREEPGWEVTAPRPFSLVCFRRDGTDEENEALLERVNATGEIFLSHTKLNGRYTLRLAVGSARTTEADVRHAWDVLRREAARAEAA